MTYEKANLAPLTQHSFTDNGLVAGTTYYYIVDIVDADNNANLGTTTDHMLTIRDNDGGPVWPSTIERWWILYR